MDEQTEIPRLPVLIVDDSRLMRVAARKILKEQFEVEEAEDGDVAWDMIQAGTEYAVVLSDLSMPNLGGLGLLDKVRAADDMRIKHLPVVIVTGAEDDTAAKEEALEHGASDFITKPFDSVQLLARTKAQVKLKQTSEALDETAEALEKRSNLDPLTGLLNLQAFSERGEQDLAYAVRHKSELGMIRFEALGFNKIFLRHGKAAAEQVLVDIAQVFKTTLRCEDTAARLGMAQFGILLPGFNVQGTRQIAERFAEKITALEYEFGNACFNAGISAPTITPETHWNDLLTEAETYLAESKAQGANRMAWDEAASVQAKLAAAEPVPEPIAPPAPATDTKETLPPDLAVGELGEFSLERDASSTVEPVEEAPPSSAPKPEPESEPAPTAALDLGELAFDSVDLDNLDLPEATPESSQAAMPAMDFEGMDDLPSLHIPETDESPANAAAPGGSETPAEAAPDFDMESLDFAPLEVAPAPEEPGTAPANQDALDIAAALEQIKRGNSESLEPHIDALVKEVIPLLELWDTSNGNPLSVAFNTLRRRLGMDGN